MTHTKCKSVVVVSGKDGEWWREEGCGSGE